MTEQPTISIIMATYNRSNVLALAIESVLTQTYPNWELLVVGDACTDDTEEVVASFKDERIRFIQLQTNCGEQSGPNNKGFEEAKGSLISYLNHDDLWFPDHLETAMLHLKETQADLVYTLVDFVHRDRPNEIGSISPGARYHPTVFAPASCWLLRREIMEEIGGWRFYRECHLVPSQDWLFRAWQKGKRLVMVPSLTVVAIQSGKRKNVYANRECDENRDVWSRMVKDDTFRCGELAKYLASQPEPMLKHYGAGQLIRFAFRRALTRLLCALGCHPYAAKVALQHRKKGALIDRAREIRGLPALPRDKQKV